MSSSLKTLQAVKEKVLTGPYKGFYQTIIYQNNEVKAIYPPEIKQPRKGQRTIKLNGWTWGLEWPTDKELEKKPKRYSYYMMDDQWFLYDLHNAKLADGWGAGGLHKNSLSDLKPIINKMNKEGN